ncbi:hypothetical protein BDF14DRAFT_1999988 [Spinellus fusiger]|nr:hypothetical protein BDF14DRAFT_1999988 [Spinellus fusiger]
MLKYIVITIFALVSLISASPILNDKYNSNIQITQLRNGEMLIGGQSHTVKREINDPENRILENAIGNSLLRRISQHRDEREDTVLSKNIGIHKGSPKAPTPEEPTPEEPTQDCCVI